MGEEILLFTPIAKQNEAAIEQDVFFQENEDVTEETQMKDSPISQFHGDEGEALSEEEKENPIQENDVVADNGMNMTALKEMDEKENGFQFQEFKDTDCCIIPSPVLKGDSVTSFFGPDLTSAIQILGTKYNELVNKYQKQNDITEKLKVDCETVSNKCVSECEPKYAELKDKYTQECLERKRLYNEIIELKGNIRVFCRCRPLSSEEESKGFASVVEFDLSHDSEFQVVCADNSKKQFKFDHVFSPKADQEAVFAETLPVVKSVLDGYNVCIFAYGQTGTGKTFTMEGTSENRGVNYRALEELFRGSAERISVNRYEFSVSMLEVYNEKIRDLLSENSSDQPAKKLEIKQIDGIQDVPGLVDTEVCSMDEVWEILKTGGKNRSVGSTNANELSSRSHCLVRVTVKGENIVNGERNRSHMWLVDLAGSERVGKTEVEGGRLKESQFINKSLSALGDVIAALASKNPHIPYRNSKLTHLLQSSLGGDCKTLMFAQISPSSADLGETLCSLNFASRVRGIEYGPARKQSDPAESFKLKQMSEKLRQEEKETARLSESLQLMQLKYASRENVFKTLQEKIKDAEQTNRNYHMKVRELESQLADEKKAAKAESSFKFYKPPLAPVNERRPLSGISTSNRLQPGGASRRSTITTTFRSFENNNYNKENVYGTSTKDKMTTMTKARRISLSPVVRSIPIQPKRRASIAILPSESEKRSSTTSNNTTSTATQQSQLRMIPRRRLSVTTFASAPRTPPDGKGLINSLFSRSILPSGEGSSSKFSSPTNMQAVWKSRQSCGSSMNKLCFSVQKRVIVGSPAAAQQQLKYNNNNQNNSMNTMFGGGIAALGGNRSVVGRLGTAQRVVMTKRRRQSVI